MRGLARDALGRLPCTGARRWRLRQVAPSMRRAWRRTAWQWLQRPCAVIERPGGRRRSSNTVGPHKHGSDARAPEAMNAPAVLCAASLPPSIQRGAKGALGKLLLGFCMQPHARVRPYACASKPLTR
eukprot:364756-Chlamydomonas_euryale.AAC.9